ncbi:Long-chain fatty-acid-CoA ligase, Mycobacterial subgroup FadD15 [Actinomycetales bacterium JB111]|nr:Long-chain fatty-acid-CoA ligase, Mycobacterial subgroup FadD15 [Actinomycetales bacterium JB111]
MTRPTSHTEGRGDFDESTSIPDLLLKRVSSAPSGTLIERRSGADDGWAPTTATDFEAEVLTVAKGLIGSGVQVGDRVAIMSPTRYEWTLLDFAAWYVGAVPVPIYETSSAEQAEWILSNAGITLAFVDGPERAAVIEEAAGLATEGFEPLQLRETLAIDDGAIDELVRRGKDVTDSDVAARRDAITGADLATIIYTSGTTGRPKGVELTHGNFVALVVNGVADPNLRDVVATDGSRTLLFIPLAHVFGRFVEVLVVHSGAVLGHSPDIKQLVPNLQSFRPTFLLAVPRVFEKVYNSADAKASASPVKRRIFRWAAKVAERASRAEESPQGVGAALRAQLKVADRLVFSTLREIMGGQLRYAVSGGGPLGARLGHFFRGMGLVVLEGYGLTESGAPTSVNLPGRIKIGTVGPAYPGTSVRVADSGEIEISGPHVFRGYYGNPDATAEVFAEDGWFRTGDLGSLDSDGYLTITGRAKEIIVTAGGKNVAPAILEDRLRGHPIVSQVVVVGEGKPFIGALITLDAEMLPQWLENHSLPAMSVAEAAKDPKVAEAMEAAVARTNRAVSRAESIRKFTILATDFTEDNGYLTPSSKVKRTAVLRDFTSDIEGIYAG